MKITICSEKTLLTPCTLDRFDYQLDPYIGCGHLCYYCYVLSYAETDWKREIQVFRDIVGQLQNELKDLTPQTIYMGYHTDPYQPCEAKLGQTRRALEVLQENGFSASILTKSDLILRDLEILKAMDAASVSVSVSFKNNRTRTIFEANTVETEKRIEALRVAKQAGVQTGALLCPVIPYLTEARELLEDLAECADSIWIYGLSVNSSDPTDEGWKNTSHILDKHFPDHADQIKPAVLSSEHPYWAQLRETIWEFNKDRQLDLRVHI